MMVKRTMTRLAACALSAALAAAATAVTLGGVPAAHAAGASVAVSVDGGTLNLDGNTAVALSGSGFQSVKNGFGGIYVLFGWVNDPSGGSWKPSQGGVTGESYKYVPDDENDPAGYDVFVAFPGSSTASAANGGTIASDGTWSATITVPGARFTSYDRNGDPSDVDCTAVQCGIITIGAHGVANANNETFTPLTFGASAAAAQDAVAADASGSGETAAAGDGSASGGQSAATTVTPQSQSKKKTTASKTNAGTGATAADAAVEGTDMGTIAAPTLGVAGTLIVAAGVILGIAVIVLAAGMGGYLAAKSLLLGVSPAALEKEMARRERRAEAVRAREELKSAKRRRRQAERLAREQAKAGRAQGLLADADAAMARATLPEAADGVAVAGDGAVAGGAMPGRTMPVVAGAVGDETQVLAPPTGETTVMPAVARRAADIRGFFTRHAATGASDDASSSDVASSSSPSSSPKSRISPETPESPITAPFRPARGGEVAR